MVLSKLASSDFALAREVERARLLRVGARERDLEGARYNDLPRLLDDGIL